MVEARYALGLLRNKLTKADEVIFVQKQGKKRRHSHSYGEFF